jgi:flagellar assembly protein FliH
MEQPVIKRGVADELFANSRNFNFQSVEERAREIIERARREADDQLKQVRAEVDRMRAEIRGEEFEAARKEGFDKGYEEGLKEGHSDGISQAHNESVAKLTAEIGELPETLKYLMGEIETRRARLVEDAERDLLALALAIGERLMRKHLATSPELVHQIVRDAVDLVLNRASLDLYVAPGDVDAIEKFLPSLKKDFADSVVLQLHGDRNLSRGSVIVRTGRGKVAFSLDQQVDDIARELLGLPVKESLALVGADQSHGTAVHHHETPGT